MLLKLELSPLLELEEHKIDEIFEVQEELLEGELFDELSEDMLHE